MFKWNRFLAAVLSASMVFTMAPVQGLAADQSAMTSQEESVANEAEEENDNGADAGSGTDQAANADSSQSDDNGANAESGANAGADDSGKQDVDPSDENDGDEESQSGSGSDAVSTSTEGISEDGTDVEMSNEEDGEEEESSDDVTVTTEAAEEGLTEEGADTDPENSGDEIIYEQPDPIEVHIDLGDRDALFEEYANRMFYGKGSSAMRKGSSASGRLTKAGLLTYTKAKNLVTQIADGQESLAIVSVLASEMGDFVDSNGYTAEDLGVSQLYVTGTQTLTAEAEAAFYNNVLDYNATKIVYALMYDCAYELYWNTGSFSYSTGIGKGADRIYAGNIYLYFNVDSTYLSDDTTIPNHKYTADPNKTGAVRTAVNNANRIVNEAAGMRDYYKLNYYREQICELVEYDFTAAADPNNYPDHGPWNLINVFDNNPATNVVCEGYSEAFQYLAEKTTFNNSSVEVYSVTGTMSGGTGEGKHKWNIVHMDDEMNYMADITNSEGGSIGSNGDLFLKGMSGSVDTNYSKSISGRTIKYTYHEQALALYSTEQLTLSASDYGVQPPETADDKAVLKGLSLILSDKIGMRVYVKTFADLANTDSIVFSCAGQTKQVPVADAEHMIIQDVDGSNIPVLVFELELWTKQMTDDVTFHMVVDGMDGASKTYSVRSYADQILAGNYSDKEKNMVRAMLNYGGYAQNYLNYNTGSLANSSIFDELPDPVQAEDPVLTDYDYTLTEASDTQGFDIQQAALQLGTDVQLVFYYKLTGGKTNSNFTFELVGSNKDLEFGYDSDKGLNTVTIRHILPYELNQMFMLKVTPKNSSSPVMTINYGPFSYCKAKIEHGSTAIKNLCKSLYYYWEAALGCHFNNMATLTARGYTFTVELTDSYEGRAFAEWIPVTIPFSCGPSTGYSIMLNGTITNQAESTTGFHIEKGDLILSGNDRIYISFINGSFSNAGVFTKIGKITNTENLDYLKDKGYTQFVFSAE